MKSLQTINRLVIRLNCRLEKAIGARLEPHILVACATIFVTTLQVLLFLALSNNEIYCRIPSMRFFHICKAEPTFEKLPTIYVITPTYSRHVQKAELTRLSQTLMLVPNVHWILVEDSAEETALVANIATRLHHNFGFDAITLLHEPTPEEFKLRAGDPSWKYPKGVWQRNRAIGWIRENVGVEQLPNGGVIYFADDDNTYDLELFNEMRFVEGVAVWPVGLAGGLLVERPLVSRDHNDVERVTDFNSLWEPDRPFPIDMAGFALNLQLVLDKPNTSFSASQRIGYIESHFLGQFVKSWKDLEPKASGCRRILVWHTKTKNPTLHEERKLQVPSHAGIDW